MRISDSITNKLNAIEGFARSAPNRYFLIKAFAWIFLFFALMVSNFIAIARWPIAWISSRTSRKEASGDLPRNLSSASELDAVLKQHRIVLADFWAQWCGPCMLMNPAIEDISRAYSNRIYVVKIDASMQSEICRSHQVRGLPTLVLFKDGVEIDRRSGSATAQDLATWIDSH